MVGLKTKTKAQFALRWQIQTIQFLPIYKKSSYVKQNWTAHFSVSTL